MEKSLERHTRVATDQFHGHLVDGRMLGLVVLEADLLGDEDGLFHADAALETEGALNSQVHRPLLHDP